MSDKKTNLDKRETYIKGLSDNIINVALKSIDGSSATAGAIVLNGSYAGTPSITSNAGMTITTTGFGDFGLLKTNGVTRINTNGDATLGAITSSSTIDAVSGFKYNGTAGFTGTVQWDDSATGNTVTLTAQGGIITSLTSV